MDKLDSIRTVQKLEVLIKLYITKTRFAAITNIGPCRDTQYLTNDKLKNTGAMVS